ncbi:MAG: ABC transporter permease [Deltaproteobacteria bacterium]|nr:ABC transporter permease [Deltaproteobacteria bacterium]
MILSLAARNLWRNRRRTLIALTALVIGSFMVVVLNGFRNGVIDLMTEGMVKAQLGAFQVHRQGYLEQSSQKPLTLHLEDTTELLQRILANPGVQDLAPRLSTFGMASARGRSSLVALLAGDPKVEARVFPLASRFVAGRNLGETDLPNAAVLGGVLMQNLGLKQGEVFTVSAQTPEGQSNAMDLQVEGWVPLMDPFSAKRLLALPLGYAQQLLRMEGRITEYAVQVHDLHRIEEVAQAARQALGDEYEVHTWLELQPLFRDLIRRQTFVLSAVSLLLAIVLTGIVNVMAMSVYERVREIGTEMALGMRRRQILLLFLCEGGFLGLWGSLAGTILGFVAVTVADVYGIPFKAPGASGTMPMHPTISVGFAALVVAVAAIGTLGAALVAAFRASRLRPADALRAL